MSTRKYAMIASAAVLLSTTIIWSTATFAQNPRGGGDVPLPLPGGTTTLATAMDLASRGDLFRLANPESRVSTWKGSSTVYGKAFAHGATPVDSAEAFRTQTLPMLGVNPDDLRLGRDGLPDGVHTVGAMLDPQTGEYKFTVISYTQEREGVPVYGSRLTLMVRNEPGFPLVLAESNLRDLGAFAADKNLIVKPNLAAAVREAKRHMDQAAQFTAPRSIIWAGTEEMTVATKAAVEFNALGTNPATGLPDHRLFIADAATGAILHQESLIIDVDVTGNVSGMSTPGIGAMACSPPAVLMPMPYARVGIGATFVFADVNGNFIIPNAGAGSVQVDSLVRGRYFIVNNNAGSGGNAAMSLNVTPPGPANFIYPATTEFLTAQTNVYIHSNIVRDFVLAYHPTFPVIANEVNFAANTAVAGTCNAFYSSANQSINFYNTGGGCNNTSFSSVIHHEYGHRIVNAAGSGQGAYGEGFGDTMSMLIADDPCLGSGFQTCGVCLRNATQNCQYTTTGCSSCGSAIHACGVLFSGCVWSTRNNLIVTNPVTYRQIINNLAVNSVILHGNVTTITPAITVHFLTLDDNDANILNGTPHYAEIGGPVTSPGVGGGFSLHNMPGPALVLGLYTTPTTNPSYSGLAGGPYSPASVAYSIENVEAFPINYQITSAQPWVSVSSSSGTIPANTILPITVSINSNANVLANGVYNSLLTITNLTNGNGNTTRNVGLEVGRLVYGAASVPMPIPDFLPAGASNTITINDAYCVGDLDVQVNITHATAAQLRLDLISPQGVVVRLHNGAAGVNLVKTYDDATVPPSGPGLLANFNGSVVTGAWRLVCADVTSGTLGTLNSWSLRIIPGPNTCPPSAFAQSVQVPVIVTSNVTLSGTTATANPLGYVINSLPANATLLDPNGGTIGSVPYTLLSNGNLVRYKPGVAFAGADSFSFLVNDGQNSNPAVVSVTVGGKETVHLVNMNTNPGWSGTVAGEWGFGQPTGGGVAGQFDPTSGFTGTNVYGYNLAGHYPNNLTPIRWLTSTAFNMTGATQCELRFRRWLGMESATFDHAYIDYSTNGTTWTNIYNHTAGTFSEQTWTLQTYQIPLADNQPTVYVRWGMGITDGSVTRQGWNIDDVEMRGIRPPCLADTANNDRIVNIDDLVAVITNWGVVGGYGPADVAPPGGNGVVDIDDLVTVITSWGVCP